MSDAFEIDWTFHSSYVVIPRRVLVRAHYNPPPMFGLREPHNWTPGPWIAGDASYGGSFVYLDGNYINRTKLQRPATTPESP